MKTLTRTVRLMAAATAVATTLALFSAVISIAEPERGVLMAKIQRQEKPAPAPLALALASDATARQGK